MLPNCRQSFVDQKGRFSRRRFFEFGTGAFATAGVLAGVKAPSAAHNTKESVDVAGPDSAPIMGKIALEEHFSFAETVEGSYGACGGAWCHLSPERGTHNGFLPEQKAGLAAGTTKGPRDHPAGDTESHTIRFFPGK